MTDNSLIIIGAALELGNKDFDIYALRTISSITKANGSFGCGTASITMYKDGVRYRYTLDVTSVVIDVDVADERDIESLKGLRDEVIKIVGTDD